MISFLRWSGRVLFALLVLVLLACTGVILKFEDWKKAKLAELDAGSRVLATEAGDIEFTERGTGPAVLICHGAPGGYDQAMLIGDALAKNGFRVIAPSRPGFLRTPLTTGLLFEDQADALATLLRTLKIDRASVIGFSTGAQVAARFALRHPDRTDALVLVSPVTVPYVSESEMKSGQLLTNAALFGTTGDMGSWFFVEQAKRDPRWMLDAVFAWDTNLSAEARDRLDSEVLANPVQLGFFRALLGTQAPLSPRESGTRNDLLMIRALDPVSYEKIKAPTLVISGSADAGKKWADPRVILEKMPAAASLVVEGAGHLVWFGPNGSTVDPAIRDFLAKSASAPADASPAETGN